ncbi:hypothetical protein NSK_005980 [Nannochloropsis salina CCMP1776]|uniref:Uncharacterized protein n=1 Tax=Nannochloropsis salina CCMP1776 TaxID=1027361 RepID=A0A4D9CX94_9STRA|nr:hypothetical protein NSK_005980 [Nannochloropsis salina CCMP1776]|eukprot:TFJ82787.1 hypothetical protein NSK_005980 [Nannochloropsis salina CCMP1776]
MRELQAEHPSLRGPLLAELEWRRRRVEGGGEGEEEALGEAVVRYVERFESKLCCFDDVLPCLQMMVRRKRRREGERAWTRVVGWLEARAEETRGEGGEEEGEEEGRAAAVRRLQCFIRTQQLLRFLKGGLGSEGREGGSEGREGGSEGGREGGSGGRAGAGAGLERGVRPVRST